jgi:hypothetical protein
MQLADPTDALSVPTPHALHGPPSLPVNCAEHRHSVLPEEDSEFAGHVSHAAVPPTLLKVPASHSLHEGTEPPEAQFAVKPPDVVSAIAMKVTRMCSFVAVYVISASAGIRFPSGIPSSQANSTKPFKNVASSLSATITWS